jgi:hypothetical protein
MVPKSYAKLLDELAETRANRLQHWLAGSKDAFVKKTYLTNRAKCVAETKFIVWKGDRS